MNRVSQRQLFAVAVLAVGALILFWATGANPAVGAGIAVYTLVACFLLISSSGDCGANETVEIHSNQRDYLGPFEIVTGNQALYLMLNVVGPPVDVMVVNKQTGDVWREGYQTGKPMGGPPGPVLAGGPLYPGTNDTRRYPLSQVLYYVVVDNTSSAGTMAPPVSILNPLGDAVATVSYVAQLGE